MAYDEALARRVREQLAGDGRIVEKRMFGGVAFLLDGNVGVGVHRDALIVRIDPADAEAALAEPGVRLFDITGRPMKGWLLVEPQGVAGAAALGRWVRRGVDFAASLHPKG